jgi:putative DeoR family transcriptional regulator (stage III sporulation protein D)
MTVKGMIEERAIELGKYVVETKATVRQAAKVFGVSKSTVHKDLTERLPRIHPGLYAQVRQVLNINMAQRHIRGGQATLLKYRKK